MDAMEESRRQDRAEFMTFQNLMVAQMQSIQTAITASAVVVPPIIPSILPPVIQPMITVAPGATIPTQSPSFSPHVPVMLPAMSM
jgi:hypothetical protein